ncbi:aldolase [Microthyrium microscopicum]|uniref:Aldolase n=1 Tax=Microthyrium microscopicum TaxID=703497 RepID=A0A6A6U2Q7_9PEZI|nr:aldolase [Microthyrium microscopicum]
MATSTEIRTETRLRPNGAINAIRKKRSIIEIQALLNSEQPALLVVYGSEQEEFVNIVGDVLGQASCLLSGRDDIHRQDLSTIVGIPVSDFVHQWNSKDSERVVVYAHNVDGPYPPDNAITSLCHYEYLYRSSPFDRRDLSRYLSFILGQISPHRDLAKKERTSFISTTFPDVNAALPNLEILSVGADAIELRVDLLKEPLPDGSFRKIPSLEYVGEQVMTLRQRTELPIIYTTRCTNENGRFPMDDPTLFYDYLYKAIQWGCEYIDVELWLPAEIRRALSERKGATKIISAFHDFSGNFKWTAPEARELFRAGAVYGDVVKMIVVVSTMQENYELEYFRSMIQAEYSHPPLSGLNMNRAGQISRCFNKIFTPITHPLLPMIAAPGQLSAAEINSSLHSMGELPKLDFYGIGSVSPQSQSTFFEKCFNELSLPHLVISMEQAPYIDALIKQPRFGGAYLNPPVPTSRASSIHLSSSSRATGLVDTIVVRSDGLRQSFMGENAIWKGIRATLTRDFLPSAYSSRAALVLASSENDAASAVFALKSLQIGPIYTIGFKPRGTLSADVTPVTAIEDLRHFEHPFVIISALPGDKSLLVGPLLKHYSSSGRQPGVTAGKVFLDLTEGPKRGDPLAIASSLGWTAYSIDDVSAWTTVETIRLLVGQNVPYDFVRLACGRASF